ncbi:hypothetical protein [Umezawaea tangerina]|uniref:Uncharacterized protein n=1 Tax=Umezawaea tangerina TaxID=84725 RepID=A0A2T0TCB3_9PSEU|nr:hypothetical protein [Umezawaea tangerina]PRY43307.1 hypothetical protein CLV43_10347 [Umezawaea tangerina]
MATKSSDGGQTFPDTEAEAVDYLRVKFPSRDVASLIAAAKAEQVEQEEDPAAWWDGIDLDELVAWIKTLI